METALVSNANEQTAVEIFKGKIIHYNMTGKYGFIKVEGDEQTLFFHVSRQRSFYCCDADAEIYDNGPAVGSPSIGDEVIIYDVELVERGPRVTYWAFVSTYDDAVKVRTSMKNYRLRHREGREPLDRLDHKPIYTTVWEGKNLLEASEFNVLLERDEFNFYYFEVENEGGFWMQCADPRP